MTPVLPTPPALSPDVQALYFTPPAFHKTKGRCERAWACGSLDCMVVTPRTGKALARLTTFGKATTIYHKRIE